MRFLGDYGRKFGLEFVRGSVGTMRLHRVVRQLAAKSVGVATKTRHQVSFCGAVVAVTMAYSVALGGPVGTEAPATIQVLQDSSTAFEIVQRSGGGQEHRLLCRRLESDAHQDTWLVRFESGSGELFAARVIASVGHASISGAVGGTPFFYSAAYRENEVLFLNRSYGDLQLSIEIDLADPNDAGNELAANRLQRYEMGLRSHRTWGTVMSATDTVSELLEMSSHPDSVGRVVALAAGSMGSSARTWSIESYMDCLEKACK